jgi:hypothetical protein
MRGPNQARRLALQNEITEAVCRLGPAKTWRQIVVHAFQCSPAAQRKDRRRHPRKFLTK